jgi:hypothetical protein
VSAAVAFLTAGSSVEIDNRDRRLGANDDWSHVACWWCPTAARRRGPGRPRCGNLVRLRAQWSPRTM